MKIIAHRGLVNGPNKELENNPETISKAIEKGFDVEVDVWKIDDNWFLGHDELKYKINFSYLENERLWVHAKNIRALKKLIEIGENINFFWHQDDDVSITSKNFIWTTLGKELTSISVCVMPESRLTIKESVKLQCFGICTNLGILMHQAMESNKKY